MAQTFFPITPVEVTPGAAGSWQDVDITAHLGGDAGSATGVILHIVNNGEVSNYTVGLRKNGSSDDRTAGISVLCHCWAMIGIDASDIFEAYVGDTTDIDIYLVGYTKSGVTFKTNADDKTLSAFAAWTDIDCSAETSVDTIGLIFEIDTFVFELGFGLRKNGSSDDRTNGGFHHSNFGAVIGCDSSQICEGFDQGFFLSPDLAAATNFFLVGYIEDGAVFNTNATDVSLGVIDSWLDLSALPSGADMGFIEVAGPVDIADYGLRKNGSSENIYYIADHHPWGIVECDGSQLIEGKIENTDVDFFVVGYATPVPPAGWTGKISGVTNPAKVMGVDVANIAKVKGVASA